MTTTPTPAPQQAEGERADALYDAIEQVLLHHRLSNYCSDDDENCGYPLVDHLCSAEATDIGTGKHEIRLICDAIYNDEAARAALSSPRPTAPRCKYCAGQGETFYERPCSYCTGSGVAAPQPAVPAEAPSASTLLRGPFKPANNGRMVDDEESPFDAVMRVDGNFDTDQQRRDYAQQVCDALNAAAEPPSTPRQLPQGGDPEWVARKAAMDATDDGSVPWHFGKREPHWAEFKAWATEKLGQGYSLAVSEGQVVDPTTGWAFTAFQAGRASEPVRRPLTEAKIESIMREAFPRTKCSTAYLAFARLIERAVAHQIGGDA